MLQKHNRYTLVTPAHIQSTWTDIFSIASRFKTIECRMLDNLANMDLQYLCNADNKIEVFIQLLISAVSQNLLIVST